LNLSFCLISFIISFVPQFFMFLRQYRTKIVVQTRSQLFRQIAQNNAEILTYFKEFWTKMTEKMQAYTRQSAQRGLCAVLP